ncbi:sterol desaturase family protein [Lacibacter sp. MH-610]|uniref:sterol desaturase family protein n=1 Tax=Lacibacter sp. MH-610 TaxID=3020883 RepID=UPI003892789A
MLERFVEFWNNVTPAQRLVTVLIPLVFFWLIEYIIPLFAFDKGYKKLRHTGVNLVFLLTSFVVNLLLGIVTVAAAAWTADNHFGLMNWVAFPLWAKVLFTLFIMDLFAQYIPHYLMHKVKPLWRFHVVHHSDTHVDVSTGTRHHPGEWIIRESFTILGVVLMGVPTGLYFMHRSFQALFTYFNHANIQLPKWLDRTIGLVFVSPDMHKFHHHYKRPWTDMNFANSFSIWDRVFGTLVYDDTKKIRYGIDTLDDSLDENIGFQMKVPFDLSVQVTQPEEEQ